MPADRPTAQPSSPDQTSCAGRDRPDARNPLRDARIGRGDPRFGLPEVFDGPAKELDLGLVFMLRLTARSDLYRVRLAIPGARRRAGERVIMKHALLSCALGLAAFACGGSTSPAPNAPAPAASVPTEPTTARVLSNRDHRGVAIGGYDPVAYFDGGEPTAGDPRWAATHRGATYHFASEAHYWTFVEHPQRYVPAFGGYCAFAASVGRLSPITPTVWQIVDGRLLLQHNQHAYDLMQEDLAGNLARADRNWPRLSDENGHPERGLVNVDPNGVAVGGYDVMSYRDGEPAAGDPEIYSHYRGATYRFISQPHRAAFEANPARFIPAFGGFCAYAMSEGRLRPVDPTIFRVMNDRLLLQHSREAERLFNANPERRLALADRLWPGLEAANAN
ncbi:MAG: YHS domain-containing (seleno)protein [Sandaracinaceae bacterium]